MQNICIISANSLENENASRNRVLSFVNSFLAEGHAVNLISMDRAEYQFVQHEHFTHHKIPFIDTKIPSFMKRALLEMKIASSALNKANELNCHVNLITIPSMFLLHLSGLLKGKSTKILDIRDLSWEYLDENSLVNRVAKRIFTYSALLNFKKFNILSVTNDHELEYVSKHIQSTQKMVKVPNGVAQKVFKELSAITENTTGILTVTYVGNVGLAQDLSTLIDVSKQLPQVVFNIVGGGTDFERVSALADPQQKNLKFLGRKKFDELIEIYNNSDMLYAQLTPDFASAMPSKLYEYLSTGKYVIYGGIGVASNTLNKFDHVSLIQPCNTAVLKIEIENLMASQCYKSISLQNRILIESQYIRDITVKKLVSEI